MVNIQFVGGQQVFEFPFVGDVTKVNGGVVLQIRLDLLNKLLLLGIQGHQEEDLATGVQQSLGDFQSFLGVGHEHERAGENDSIELFLGFSQFIKVLLSHSNISAILEQFSGSLDVVFININADNLGILGESVNDRVKSFSGAGSDVEDLLILVETRLHLVKELVVSVFGETLGDDVIIDESGDIHSGQSALKVSENSPKEVRDETHT